MKAEEIVKKLLSGSTELDRMERETNQIVRMILGLVKYEKQYKLDKIRQIGPSEFPIWQIRRGTDGYNARCVLTHPEFGEVVAYTTDRTWNNLFVMDCMTAKNLKIITQRGVMIAHESLPKFVRGMADNFPDLPERWAPILEAAKKRR